MDPSKIEKPPWKNPRRKFLPNKQGYENLFVCYYILGCSCFKRTPTHTTDPVSGLFNLHPFAVRTGFEPVLSYILSGCQLNVFQSIITLPIAFAT